MSAAPHQLNTRPWSGTAAWRRFALLLLIALPTHMATGYMAALLPHDGGTALELVLVVLFALLFAWILLGFWTAIFGFFLLWSRTDGSQRPGPAPSPAPSPAPTADARTALLVPVYNEDVAEVYARLQATLESIRATGKLELFDFFVLSDSTDADHWIAEEAACERIRAETGCPRIYYRHRRNNLKRKSGNVADWCRRWGRRYRYMIVFDADSVMSGPTLVEMIGRMERDPSIGILQTAPACVGRETLLARVQQFASRFYGPMFAAGLQYWQLGEAQFWGHNAIIRVRPFMAHCALPRLAGRPPLGGEILSHDFVEAALMRRAGYGVWLAHDLGGSYEEPPPTLLDELKRDRRWCQGNLQHLRLLGLPRIVPLHRVLFVNGAMAYGSALLWLLFLALSSFKAAAEALAEPSYFPLAPTLFPQWPVWHKQLGLTLLALTAVVLFLPKLAAVALALRQRRTVLFGGLPRLLASVGLEIVISTLAPVRMLFHSKFVLVTLAGGRIGWGAQNRADATTGWAEALRFHGGGSLLALLWGTGLYALNPGFFWWMSPILVSLLLAPLLSVLSSRADWGRRLRRAGLCLIPEEVVPPRELRRLRELLSRAGEAPADGFTAAVADPRVHRIHLAYLGGHRRLAAPIARRRQELVRCALRQGPQALSPQQRRELLLDPERLRELHRAVWRLPEPQLRQWVSV